MDMLELAEILISTLVLALVFSYPFKAGFFQTFLVALIAVGSGFAFHELAHRALARYFGCEARYMMWKEGLLLAVLMRVTVGWVFAAPGAVYFSPFSRQRGFIGKTEQGLISLAGPMTNVLVALGFLSLFLILQPQDQLIASILGEGLYINLTLAFFNLIPFPPLDGSKVFSWSPLYWGMAIAAVFLLQTGLGL